MSLRALFIFGNFYTADNEGGSDMKYYYTDYGCCGWIPNPKGGGCWRYFVNDSEYREAYAEEAGLSYIF